MSILSAKSHRLKQIVFALYLCAGCGAPPTAEDAGADVAVDVQTDDGGSEEPTTPTPVAAPVNEAPDAPFEPIIEDGMALIPAGTLIVGSTPGSVDRVARSEADAISMEIAAFRIDVDRFGGDPPQVNVTRGQAADLCEEAGKRLCSELEWERACEGPSSDIFAGGETFDAAALSDFGVRGLGAYGEWTSSDPTRELAPSAEEGAVFRGAGGDQEPALRRCNARRGTDASTQSRHLGFRCCQGATSDDSYPVERNRPRFRPLDLDRDAIRALMRRVPELSEFADAFEPTDADRQLERLGDAGLATLNGWELAPAAMAWAPSPGDEVWVIHGVSGGRPLLAAVYPLPENGLQHGATLVLEEGAPPMIIAFTGPERETLRWSTNWGTSAESGVLALGSDSQLHFEIH